MGIYATIYENEEYIVISPLRERTRSLALSAEGWISAGILPVPHRGPIRVRVRSDRSRILVRLESNSDQNLIEWLS